MHRAIEETKHEESTDHNNNEADADDHTATKPHHEHEDSDDDSHRLNKINKECGEGVGDTFRLIENAMTLDAGGEEIMFKFSESLFDLLTDLDDICAGGGSDSGSGGDFID